MVKSKSYKNKKAKIRVIALGVIIKDNLIFLSQGYDETKKQIFYRALGGGVKFGESSIEALKREFQEEINASLTNINYLASLENIFIYNGNKGHEIIQLYQCDFAQTKFYDLEELTFKEKNRTKKAGWINVEKCKTGEILVVPPEFLNYI